MTAPTPGPTAPVPVPDDTIPEVYDPNGVRDFSVVRDTPVQFRIDRDVFFGVPDLPGDLMMELADRAAHLEDSEMSAEDMKAAYHAQLNLILTDESAGRYIERMSSKTEPISLPQTMQILPWLMEQYGMRPTPPSGSFSTTQQSPAGGTNSTDAQPPPASLSPRAYLQPVSST